MRTELTTQYNGLLSLLTNTYFTVKYPQGKYD